MHGVLNGRYLRHRAVQQGDDQRIELGARSTQPCSRASKCRESALLKPARSRVNAGVTCRPWDCRSPDSGRGPARRTRVPGCGRTCCRPCVHRCWSARCGVGGVGAWRRLELLISLITWTPAGWPFRRRHGPHRGLFLPVGQWPGPYLRWSGWRWQWAIGNPVQARVTAAPDSLATSSKW
jgi:hypothetical protein